MVVFIIARWPLDPECNEINLHQVDYYFNLNLSLRVHFAHVPYTRDRTVNRNDIIFEFSSCRRRRRRRRCCSRHHRSHRSANRYYYLNLNEHTGLIFPISCREEKRTHDEDASRGVYYDVRGIISQIHSFRAVWTFEHQHRPCQTLIHTKWNKNSNFDIFISRRCV